YNTTPTYPAWYYLVHTLLKAHENDAIMQHTKRLKKHRSSNRPSPQHLHIGFFPCPAGCGHHVSERDVNTHLDERCSMLGNRRAGSNASSGHASVDISSCPEKPKSDYIGDNLTGENPVRDSTDYCEKKNSITPLKSNKESPKTGSLSTTPKRAIKQETDAFSRMMKQSAKIFSRDVSQYVARHRFHMHHDQDGRITATWISNDTDASATDGVAMDQILWSANVTIKKIKSIALNKTDHSMEGLRSPWSDPKTDATTLELTISSSSAFQHSQQKLQGDSNDDKFHFVQRHSHLSVAQLKSILQKSIRRRAPLPSVRVAMELADKSLGDLLRRLPVIILEDSFLHQDIGLIVWLMVAESKGYVPSLALMVRVFQIVFEVASCPRRDELCCDQTSNVRTLVEDLQPMWLSLTTPTSRLFTHDLSDTISPTNKCETLVRAMLLRSQYGGMSCDVSMLHSYAKLWLTRFQSTDVVPRVVASCLPEFKMKDGKDDKAIYWCDLPRLLHEASQEKSKQLVTYQNACPGGLSKLNETDVCSAGIDFHCSPVVESILSQRPLRVVLFEKFASMNELQQDVDGDWIADQIKKCIWICSSGVNHRRTMTERQLERSGDEDKLKVVWDDLLRVSFEEFTKKFIRQRLA
ncbi:hypothetical protein HJC23_011447, partial [Cyclotella cryptica]